MVLATGEAKKQTPPKERFLLAPPAASPEPRLTWTASRGHRGGGGGGAGPRDQNSVSPGGPQTAGGWGSVSLSVALFTGRKLQMSCP